MLARLRALRVGGGSPATWLLAVGSLLLAGAFVWLTAVHLPAGGQPLPGRPVPVLVLLLAAVVADLAVLRIPSRRELHALGLSGGVLAIGLLTTPVLQVVLALAAARLLALVLVRDATPLQVALGTGRAALGAAMGGTTYLLLSDGQVAPSDAALAAALAAVLLRATTGFLLAVSAAALQGEPQSRRMLRDYAAAALVIALASAGLGEGAVVLLLVAGPGPVLLLLVPAGLLVLLGLGWSRGRRTRGDLSAVRRAARSLTVDTAPNSAGSSQDTAGALLLLQATTALGASRGELVLADDADVAPVVHLYVEGVQEALAPGRADDVALGALAELRRAPLLLPRLDPGDGAALAHLPRPIARWLLVRGYPDVVAVPVLVDGEGVGMLAVSGRRRGAPRLDASDLTLLHALAEQLGLRLGTARLHKRLGSMEASRQKLETRAFTDDLTGLARRPLFADRVERALSQRGAAGVAVLFIDLDGFKAINDEHGHATGDEVLRTIACRLSGLLRGGDTAARLGGDEFAVLVLGLDGEDRATLVAARVLDALSLPVLVQEAVLTVRASVGIAVACAGDHVAALLADADAAMYSAKRAGGMRWAVAERGEVEVGPPSTRREQLAAGLAAGALPGSLELHYQPAVDPADGRVVAVEALVRWDHPELGLLVPEEFVPLADRMGRMAPLGHEVLRRALAQLAAWDVSGAPGLGLSVNLSASELREPSLAAVVSAALAASGVAGDRLVLEVGEAVVSGDVDAVLPVMDELRGLGVRWALDGFGSGAVPLDRLEQLPLSCVKIPAGLLSSRAGALSAGLVGLARTLGLQVVVENVEHPEQAAQVRGLHADHAQGYHYGRPRPATAGVLTYAPEATA